MTAAFDCPKCGAPIGFEPHPGDETVECPFCHQSVIIPEELRIPLPGVIVAQQPPPKQRNVPMVLIAVVGMLLFLSCGAVLLVAIFSNQPNTKLPTDTPYFDSGSATTTVEAKATVDALQSILKLEQSWPASFTETFTDNSHNWRTGDVRDSYVTGNRSISNGTYTWNITSVQSMSDFSYPDMPDQSDFYVGVDIKLVSMPNDPNADAGIYFRYNGTDQTWYYFSVSDQGQYYFGWYDGNDWYTLIPETDSAAIHPGETNQLAVGGQGSQFIFLINGQMVDHFIDDNLKSGTIGLGVNLPETGEKATLEFSNFTVKSPSSNP